MSEGMWLPTLVFIAIADAVIVVIGLAIVADRWLLGEGRRWRFGLTTLLVFTALLAVHTAILANLFFGRSN
jgi:hypothetical protein